MNAQTDAALLEDNVANTEIELDQESSFLEDTASAKNAKQPTLDINFLALDGSPISKMGVAVRWKDGELLANTDADGAIPPVEAPPGEILSIAVQRFDGSYKKIGECCMPSSDGVLTAVSPNVVLETRTEKHEGQPGNAEKRVPTPQQGDLGDLSATSKEAGPAETAKPAGDIETKQPETAKPTENGKPAPPKPAPKPKAQPKPAEAKAKQQTEKPPQHISGKEEAKPKLEKGRDENGNPLAVITQKAIDWWNSWRMPTFNLWGTPAPVAKGGTVPATPVKVDAEMVTKVEAFLEFAREQTEYDYKASGEGTAAVLASMGKGTFKHARKEKESHIALGLCYTYVKIALSRAKIVDGVLAAQKANATQTDAEHFTMQLSASKAGPALIAKGFKDVTADVPDARWAAAGDVIVYEWSDTTWEHRKKKDPKTPNHGHIDIRDYDFYISDFIPLPPAKFGHPTWRSYVNIRIYRKVFDPLPTQRIRAFLRCIREFECQAEKDDSKRYQMLNAPLPSGDRRFSSYETHPWDGQGKPLKGSTAAGAYQILSGTWQEIFEKELIKPKGDRFSPTVQDRIAVMKLEDRGVLHLIRTGRIQEALELKGPNGSLAVPSEWTSLPGGKENAHRLTADKKPMNMAYFQTLFDQYLNEEKAKG